MIGRWQLLLLSSRQKPVATDDVHFVRAYPPAGHLDQALHQVSIDGRFAGLDALKGA